MTNKVTVECWDCHRQFPYVPKVVAKVEVSHTLCPECITRRKGEFTWTDRFPKR